MSRDTALIAATIGRLRNAARELDEVTKNMHLAGLVIEPATDYVTNTAATLRKLAANLADGSGIKREEST